MTPVYLNPSPSPFPFVELKEEQHLQLFLSPQQAASSLAADHPSFFNTASQDRRVVLTKPEEPKPYDHKARAFFTRFLLVLLILYYI